MMDNKRRQIVGLFAVVFYLNVFTSKSVYGELCLIFIFFFKKYSYAYNLFFFFSLIGREGTPIS